MKHSLTSRELEIARLISRDRPTKEIALTLCLSPKTVESYRTEIHKKLGTHSPIGIARYIWQLEGLNI